MKENSQQAYAEQGDSISVLSTTGTLRVDQNKDVEYVAKTESVDKYVKRPMLMGVVILGIIVLIIIVKRSIR